MSVQAQTEWVPAGFIRRAPYLLAVLAFALATALASALDVADAIPTYAVWTVIFIVAHWFCVDRRWPGPFDDRIGATYVVARTIAAFFVTWMNPFFAVFACVGYFDCELHLRGRLQRAVIVVTAITIAGSQAGGFPPSSAWQAVAFVGLFVLNFGLYVFFDRQERRQQELSDERERTIAALESANARLAEAMAENERLQSRLLEQAREAGVHAERERLALEIHDTIAQSLAGIVTQLRAAENGSGSSEAVARRQRAADLAQDALTEARRSVQGLLPHRLDDTDLPTAVEDVVADWGQATEVAAAVLLDGEPVALHRDIEATVLRVVQEALANVDKHAQAGRVVVTLAYMEDLVTLDVRDDGRGFANGTAEAGPGVGLRGMRQRAARIAGRVAVESEPGAGTAVSLQVPVVEREAR